MTIALITDSGTPCISDPGFLLVNECLQNNLKVIPIPGPSAFLALLVSSGLRTDKFFFHGFLSSKKGTQKNQLSKMSLIKATHIIYESPHRLIKLIDNINEIFPKKIISIGKELTKINENILIGNCESIKDKMKLKKILGEYVILIANY